MRINGEREIGDIDTCMHCGEPIKLNRIYIDVDYVPDPFGHPICIEEARGDWFHILDGQRLCCNNGCGAHPKNGDKYNENDADGYF